jgi:TPR repeat protein
MKIGFFAMLLLLSIGLQSNDLLANDMIEMRTEADQYYLEHDYKKAYKKYFKVAKTGDHYAQGRIARMYANGEGKSVDLTEAYAWSVLAQEGSGAVLTESSEDLLQRTDNKAKAQEKALKLQKKYGQQALRDKARKRAEADAARRSGNSMGSNLSR